MNKKLVNIALLVLFLSGCNLTSNKQSNGEPLNKNAPLFIRPNTNAQAVNKPTEPTPIASKPAVVNFNAEKYVMVKESDLNKLVIQKTNEALRNKLTEVKPITNEKEVNKRAQEPGSPVESNQTQILNQLNSDVQTVETVRLEPIKNTLNPVLSFLTVFSVILGFILLIGYLFFFRKKNVKSDEAPQTPEPSPETEKKTEDGSTPAA